MNLFAVFKRSPPLLRVLIDSQEVCAIGTTDVPCERTPSTPIGPGTVVEFLDQAGIGHRHVLHHLSGWCHLSVRVHEGLTCQADCVVSDSERLDPSAFSEGRALGVRFQPFFISGSKASPTSLIGRGLFARGLHFSGTISGGNLLLSCECDNCKMSFLIRSYHSGFSGSGYFYSASGKYTLAVDSQIPGSPAALSSPDPDALAALEAKLPLAPDGTAFGYLNPFRCPHCTAPYIDFGVHPEDRATEYYGNYFNGAELLQYIPGDG